LRRPGAGLVAESVPLSRQGRCLAAPAGTEGLENTSPRSHSRWRQLT